MPIELEELPQGLTEAARAGLLVPFVGAGLSRFVGTSDPAFPSWKGFLLELVEVAEKEGDITSDEKNEIDKMVHDGKFLMAAQAIRSAIAPDLFESYIQKRFSPADAQPSLLHRSIFSLQPSLIITTNYDHLLEDAYAAAFGRTCEVVGPQEMAAVINTLRLKGGSRDRPLVYKVHGSASFPSSTIFGEMDYRRLIYQQPGYRTLLTAVFVTRVVLMVGLSISDPEVTPFVDALRDAHQHTVSPSYVVLEKGNMGSLEKKHFRDDFGLEVIEYEATNGYSELLRLVNYLASFVEETTTASESVNRTRSAKRKTKTTKR